MKYKIKASKQYKKDYKKMIRSGKDMQKLFDVIDLLAVGKALPKYYNDHFLKGSLKKKRECHITSDWLLMYEKDEDMLMLLLLRTGDHRHVLGIE